MNITNEIIDRAVGVAKCYDKTPLDGRAAMSAQFDEVTDGLSDNQCVQLAKIVARKI